MLCFGNMWLLVVGVEVVMFDGGIWYGFDVFKKDNCGYDIN